MDINKLLNELHLQRRRIDDMIRTLESLAASRPEKPFRAPVQRKSGASTKPPRRDKTEKVSSIGVST